MRIIAAHAYHRIDCAEVWITLRDDVPKLAEASRVSGSMSTFSPRGALTRPATFRADLAAHPRDFQGAGDDP